MHNDIFVVCYSYRIRKFVDFFLSVTDPSYRFRQSSSSLQNSSYRSNGTTIEVWVTTLGSASLVNEKKYNFVKVKWQKIQLCESKMPNCWQQFVILLSQSCIFVILLSQSCISSAYYDNSTEQKHTINENDAHACILSWKYP